MVNSQYRNFSNSAVDSSCLFARQFSSKEDLYEPLQAVRSTKSFYESHVSASFTDSYWLISSSFLEIWGYLGQEIAPTTSWRPPFIQGRIPVDLRLSCACQYGETQWSSMQPLISGEGSMLYLCWILREIASSRGTLALNAIEASDVIASDTAESTACGITICTDKVHKIVGQRSTFSPFDASPDQYLTTCWQPAYMETCLIISHMYV